MRLTLGGVRSEVEGHSKPAPAGLCNEWLEEWGSIWGVPQLAAGLRVVFSPRLTRTLGRCTPHAGSIRLNPCLQIASIDVLREVVCHEAAHVAVWMLRRAAERPHGDHWRALVRLIGYEPSARLTVAVGPSPRGRARRESLRYVHACTVCGSSWIAMRRVSTWRCGTCLGAGLDGRLEVSTRSVKSR